MCENPETPGSNPDTPEVGIRKFRIYPDTPDIIPDTPDLELYISCFGLFTVSKRYKLSLTLSRAFSHSLPCSPSPQTLETQKPSLYP